jgi:quercetin dioxygenase-like cupin family protein
VEPRAANNGRKVLVNGMYADREHHASEPEWEPGPRDGTTPVVETGRGGMEISTFTHEAAQDCHKHLLGTEIYTVLEGSMAIRVDDREIVLEEGDEVVVFPGTPHEVLDQGTEFLARVHCFDCHGEDDKYVLADGVWVEAKKPG